ncbi:MAG: glycosyltransferase [Oscillatoriales cyanobacterium]|nr:MAG: glycosyltransferase [Oscillatoriales cyanobacterium]
MPHPSDLPHSLSRPLPRSIAEIPLPDPLPPLVLPVFTRPDLLVQVLEGLKQQSQLPTQIIALVDGARSVADELPIETCMALLRQFAEGTGDRVAVKFITRSQNLGCDRNIITGLTEVLSQHDSLVYLEDDIVPNPNFFDCMSRLLAAYRDRPEIFSISAYSNFPEAFYREIQTTIQADFVVSQRVFSCGWAVWADRWQAIDLVHQSPQFNPFGAFYKIPIAAQTKMTAINQFWLEKNHKTDWVISTTLAALAQGKLHLVPRASLTYNVGFGHAEAKTYNQGGEPAWANARYDRHFEPDRLPATLELSPSLAATPTGSELAAFFDRQGIWLNGAALWFFVRKYPDLPSIWAWVRLGLKRSRVVFSRWRKGLLT